MSIFLVYLLCLLLSFNGNMLYAQEEEAEFAYTEEQTPDDATGLNSSEEEDAGGDSDEFADVAAEAEGVEDEFTGESEKDIEEVQKEDLDAQEDAAKEGSEEEVLESEDEAVEEVEEDSKEAQGEDLDTQEDAAEEVLEPEGIDTVDINEPEGNWLFKRIWWEKSKDLFGKIRDKVDKIVESRMYFFEQRVKLDREYIDPFYVDIGLDQGALRESVDNLLNVLKSEREKDGVLNDAEVDAYNKLVESKVALEKLSESVSSIQQLDAGLDEALKKLTEQINLARSYERDAWRLLNEIAEELSDKKAREHYYAIATLWRNVKEIAKYIEGAFGQHFLQLSKTSIENIQNINQAIDDLQEKGVAIKETVEANHEEEATNTDDDDEEVAPAPKKEIGWFSWMWQKVTGWFSW